ncbi:MAG: RHS repeat-associated core domain-containing protein, partial [Candidatus Omnitrophica bacterium]|nr:RHS repeat-associated core domain-containing protein [Candidatus Omnitrophota bacterium]
MGSRIDEPLTMTRSSTTYYYLTDGLGSVRQLANASGTIVESYDYDPYGQVTIYNSSLTDITSSGSGIDNPYMFTGRRLDEETGIYHYRARQYDPAIGRFLQRDPIGYKADMNLFRYTWNNPVNFTDPKGLIPPIPLPGIPTLPFPNTPMMCMAGPDDLMSGASPEDYPSDPETPPEEKKDTNWELVGIGLLQMGIGGVAAWAGGAGALSSGGIVGGSTMLFG